MFESCLSPPQTNHLKFFIDEISESTESLDRAYFVFQDLVIKEGRQGNVEAFNILLSACINLNDTSRALSTYRDAATFRVQPNVETYNIILNASQNVARTDLAMYILSDMKAAQIKPNAITFNRVIHTFLLQQGPAYEDAFVYLEEMKAAGFIPSPGIYAAFIKKCVYNNDDRARLLLEEMKNSGHDESHLAKYIQNAARFRSGSQLFSKFNRNRMGKLRLEESSASRKAVRKLAEDGRAA